MSGSHLGSVVEQLHRLAALGMADGYNDTFLLERFIARQDPDAFAALVGRHGPLVWRVCRRVLARDERVEDCFQATFLVLARRASSIRKPSALRSWLHGVAFRIARDELARLKREEPVSGAERLARGVEPAQDAARREVGRIVEEEVHALPEKLRLPILLCYWDGLTNEETARHLGCPAGTVKTRLARARSLLHERLIRRGITMPVGALALLLAPSGAEAALPASVAYTAASACAMTNAGTISARAAALAQGALRVAPLGKAKLAIALAVALGAACLGAGVVAFPFGEAPPKAGAKPQAHSGPAKADEAPRVDRFGDPLPPGALLRLGTVRHRDISTLFSGRRQFLSDGKTLLRSTANDVQHEVHWVDTATGRLTDSWELPKGLTVCGFAADGRLALLMDDTTLRIWDLTIRKELRTFEPKGQLSKQVHASFSPDGKIVATTVVMNYPGLVRVWEVSTGRLLWELGKLGGIPGHRVSGFLPDGKSIAFLDQSNNRVILRDRMTGRELRSFPTMPRDQSRSSGLSPDGKAFLMGTAGTSVRVWDMSTGEERAPLDGHKQQAGSFGFRRDSQMLLTGGGAPTVFVWDWPAGKLRQKIDLGADRHIGVLEFSADGKRAQITTHGENAPRWFDLETGKELPRPAEAHNGPIWGIAIAPDGRLVSTGYDDTFRVWDLDSGRQLHAHPVGRPLGATELSLSADGRLVVTGEFNSGTILVHDRDTGKLVRSIATEGKSMTGVGFSPTGGQLMAIGVRDEKRRFLALWDRSTGKEVRRLEGGTAPLFSPDGRSLAGFVDRQPTVWDVETGFERTRNADQFYPQLAFSPDGRLLAATTPDKIVLWEFASGQECGRIDAPTGRYDDALQFSPDGHRLARACGSGVLLFDVLRGQKIHSFAGHLSWVNRLAFTADGRRLASASYDSTVLIWDVAGTVGPIKFDNRPEAAAVAAAWDRLAGKEAKAAFQAVRLLVEAPTQSVPLLRERLKPAPAVDVKHVQKLIDDLDSDEFEIRQAAVVALEKGAGHAEQTIRKALRGEPSIEARRRLEGVLKKLWSEPSTDTLRAKRAVWVLELIGTSEARAVLQTLAGGSPSAWETREAREALERLKKATSGALDR